MVSIVEEPREGQSDFIYSIAGEKENTAADVVSRRLLRVV
jgi:hypothetical protein